MYLTRIGKHLVPCQRPGHVEAEIGIAGEDAGADIVGMLDADIAAEAAALRTVIDAIAVASVEVIFDQAVIVALLEAGLRGNGALAEAAEGAERLHARLCRACRRDEIECAAQHGCAKPVGQIPAIDFDGFGLSRIGEADDIGSVRAIDRKPVLKHQDAAFDRILLKAGTANLNAGLIVAAEEVLHHHAGSAAQRSGDRQVGGVRKVPLRNHGGTTREGIEAFLNGGRTLLACRRLLLLGFGRWRGRRTRHDVAVEAEPVAGFRQQSDRG